ncbi:hypothetical protein [uncultured Bradyrhizobium sp.]|uniref:hypothetical protein n=1 Tax=uncultured Bradyrhizobium sp. TaxID=199684 RepID=UPI00263A386F|nr:hypothetical protein [uncultured Bradyrhizobium sp.]
MLTATVLLDGVLIYAGIKLFRRFFSARRGHSPVGESIDLRAAPALPRALPNHSGD